MDNAQPARCSPPLAIVRRPVVAVAEDEERLVAKAGAQVQHEAVEGIDRLSHRLALALLGEIEATLFAPNGRVSRTPGMNLTGFAGTCAPNLSFNLSPNLFSTVFEPEEDQVKD